MHSNRECLEFNPNHKPVWYKSGMDNLEVVRSRIYTTWEMLNKARLLEVPELYSNSTLHQHIQKEQACKETLQKLDALQDRLTKMIERNEQFYQKQQNEFVFNAEELNVLKNKIINKLLKLREHDKQNLQQLRDKTSSELLGIADLTQDTTLISQARLLQSKSKSNQKDINDFYAAAPTWMQCVNAKECSELDTCAKQLAEEYFIEAEKLAQHSSIDYAVISKDQGTLFADIKTVVNSLQQACTEFSEVDTVDSCIPDIRNKIKKYNDLEHAYFTAKKIEDKISHRDLAIVQKYQQAGQNYGIYRTGQVEDFQQKLNITSKKLGMIVKDAKITIMNQGDEVEKHKLALAKWDLLLLLQQVTEYSAAFWSAQVSWLGSRFSIGNVSVPAGIEQIANVIRCALPKTKNIDIASLDLDTVLVEIKNIVSLRKQAGIGFFAKRSLHTTDEFYNFISKMDLSYFTDDSLQQVKKGFASIKDDKGRCLLNLEAPMRVNVVKVSQHNY